MASDCISVLKRTCSGNNDSGTAENADHRVLPSSSQSLTPKNSWNTHAPACNRKFTTVWARAGSVWEAKLSTPWKKMSSYTSSPRHLNEYDFDNDDIGPESCSDFDDERELGAIASDEGEKWIWKTDTRWKIINSNWPKFSSRTKWIRRTSPWKHLAIRVLRKNREACTEGGGYNLQVFFKMYYFVLSDRVKVSG